MSSSNLKVQLPNSPDSTTHNLRNLQQCDREAYSDEIINDYEEALEIIDKSFPDLGKKVEIEDVNVKVVDVDLPNTGDNKHDDPKPILDIDSGMSNNQMMQNPQQPTFQVGKDNPKFCDGRFVKTVGNPQAMVGHALVGSGQAHTAGPTNSNPQVQASLGHLGPGQAQASSTHTGPVYAGPTNGNPQDQAGHAQASSTHTGQFYPGPNNWDPQAQAGHAQASSNHTGPVHGGPTNMNLGFHHYHNLQQHAHALQHPVHAQQGVRVPNQVQSNRNWNHSIQNGPTQGQAQQYHAHHAPSYHASVQYAIAYHASANHHHATSNHGSAYHHQQQQQLSGDHLGNAFGQHIESNLRQNQNGPPQCGQKQLHENPPIAQNTGVKTRKVRTKWNNAQVFKLENKFKSQKYLDPSEREDLARQLRELERRNQVITELEVKIWFKNRRSKNGKTPKKAQIVVIED